MATLITKNSSTASSVPTAAQLVQGELAVNVTDKRLFTENSSGTVVELGTNPSTLALPNGTANGVAYLNGSKVLTTGSALTFNGTAFSADANIAALNGKVMLAYNSDLTGYAAFQCVGGSGTQSASWGLFGTGELMRLTSTGLGIGTSSPGFKLQVIGTSQLSLSAAGTQQALQLNNSDTTAGTQAVKLGFSSAGVTKASINAAVYGNDYMTFNVGSDTERMRLDSVGNLGIGTSSPNYSLTSYKGGAVANYLQVASGATGAGSGNGLLLGVDASGNSVINAQGGGVNLYTYVAGVLRTTIDSSGNLGLGTASPGGKLDVVGGSGIRVNEDGAGTKVIMVRSNFAGVGPAINVSTNDPLLLQTNNTERARITSGGDLLLNTTSSRTGVNSISIEPSGNNYIEFRKSGSGSATQIQFNRNTDTTPTSAGSIATTGTTTTYNTSSDYRLKDVTGALTGYKERLMSLQPKQGTWKVDGSEFRGFLAHEFANPYRASVTGEKDAVDESGNPIYQGMQASSSEVMADLVAMVNELITENASLKARLDAANL